MHNKSNEELIALIDSDNSSSAALAQLIKNLSPMMVKIGRQHLASLHFYETEDYIQEGSIVLWKLLQSHKYDGKRKFSNLFYTAFDRKCTSLYRNYVLQNLVQISESVDYYHYGYHIGSFVEHEYARAYIEKQKERNKRWRENKLGITSNKSRKLTEAERRERNRQRSREYYFKNQEKCREAKRRWYAENREYALKYQKAYDQGILTPTKRTANSTEEA